MLFDIDTGWIGDANVYRSTVFGIVVRLSGCTPLVRDLTRSILNCPFRLKCADIVPAERNSHTLIRVGCAAAGNSEMTCVCFAEVRGQGLVSPYKQWLPGSPYRVLLTGFGHRWTADTTIVLIELSSARTIRSPSSGSKSFHSTVVGRLLILLQAAGVYTRCIGRIYRGIGCIHYCMQCMEDRVIIDQIMLVATAHGRSP